MKIFILLLFILSTVLFSKEDEWDFVIDSTKSIPNRKDASTATSLDKNAKPSDKKDNRKDASTATSPDKNAKPSDKKDKRKDASTATSLDKNAKSSDKKDKRKDASTATSPDKNAKSQDKADKDDGMDFSGVKFESDDLDDEVDKEEEEEIDKEITIDSKKIQKVDIKKIKEEKKRKKEKKDLFLVFFSFRSQLDYQNLMLFDNLPYQNLVGFEFSTSVLGLELKNFDAYVGEIGYKLIYGNQVIHSLVLAPLTVSFYFKKWNKVFPLRVNLFKVYYFSDIIRGNSGEEISLFFEYISLNLSWKFFKDDKYSSSLFLGFSFGPDDIKSNPKREAMVFTIGISGKFSPIKIDF